MRTYFEERIEWHKHNYRMRTPLILNNLKRLFFAELVLFNIASKLLNKVNFFVSSYRPLHKDINLIKVIPRTLKRLINFPKVELRDLKINTIFFNTGPEIL